MTETTQAGTISLDAWRRKTTDIWMSVCVLAHVPAIAVIWGIQPSDLLVRKLLVLVTFATCLLGAVLRAWDYRARMWLWVGVGYLTSLIGTTAYPNGPLVRVLPITLPIIVLVILGIPAARRAIGISAVILVLGPVLHTIAAIPRFLLQQAHFIPLPLPNFLPQIISLLALLFTLLLVLIRFMEVLLQALSAQAQATDALQQEVQERRRLEEEILTISELERQRFGAEIHDGLCQQLTSGLLHAVTLQSMLTNRKADETPLAHALCQNIETLMGDAYGIARGLSTPEITPQGLQAALEDLLAQTQSEAHLSCHLHAATLPALTPNLESQLFRITQEAVRNVVKHAEARKLWMTLAADGDDVTLSICDDGRGIPPDAQSGLGIRSMMYRAQSLGGTLRVDCPAEGGVLVHCRIPRQASLPEEARA